MGPRRLQWRQQQRSQTETSGHGTASMSLPSERAQRKGWEQTSASCATEGKKKMAHPISFFYFFITGAVD